MIIGKVNKQLSIALLSLVLVGCSAILPNVSHEKSTNISKGIPIVNKGLRIKSTTDPNEIKKTFLSKQRFTRSTGNPIIEARTFNVTQGDLKRRYILNIFNGSNNTPRVSSAVIRVNGQVYASQSDFNQNVSDISVGVTNLKEGVNTIEVQLDSKPGATVDISLDGFIKPIDIPKSVFSNIPANNSIRNLAYEKGKVGIKFLEGMKVRLVQNPDGTKKLVDLNGTSLFMLEQVMKKFKVKLMYRPLGVPYEQLDQDEIKAEALFGSDVPNMNLFYYFTVDEKTDIWSFVDELRKIPFLEEAFPKFILKSQSLAPSDLNPLQTEPELNAGNTFIDNHAGTQKIVEKSDWLKNTTVAANSSNSGAWSLTRGSSDIKVAVIDSGFQIDTMASNLSTHEDLNDSSGFHLEPYNNIDISSFPQYATFVDPTNKKLPQPVKHGTATSGIIGALGNNNTGVAGVAYKSTIMPIFGQSGIPSDFGDLPSYCIGSGVQPCDSIADSILLARKKGAKVLSLSLGADDGVTGYTLEQISPVLRTAITTAVADNRVVLIASGNDTGTDISIFPVKVGTGNNIETEYRPTFDTGSIIVGGLTLDGKSLLKTDLDNFNYSVSVADGLFTKTYIDKYYGFEHGHGVDVSGPAEDIWTTSFNLSFPSKTNEYNIFGGSSGTTPIAAGVAALILSLKPDLPPLEIRKTLREKRQDSLLRESPENDPNNPDAIRPIAGMIDAYSSVLKYASPNLSPGLFAKFYANTVYLPPETRLWDSSSSQENTPISYKYSVSNLQFPNNSSDPFNINLNNFYVADLQGIIKIPSANYYEFYLAHDDGAILQIDGQTIIDGNYPNAFTPENPNFGVIFLSEGEHSIRLMLSQITGYAGLSLKWKPSGADLAQPIPESLLFHNRDLENTNIYTYRAGLVGRFFTAPIFPPFQDSKSVQPMLYPFKSKILPSINFTHNVSGLNINGDIFNISDTTATGNTTFTGTSNYSAFISGFLKLPTGYSEGNYKLIVGSDDGVSFYLNGKQLVNNPGPHFYTEDIATDYTAPFSILSSKSKPNMNVPDNSRENSLKRAVKVSSNDGSDLPAVEAKLIKKEDIVPATSSKKFTIKNTDTMSVNYSPNIIGNNLGANSTNTISLQVANTGNTKWQINFDSPEISQCSPYIYQARISATGDRLLNVSFTSSAFPLGIYNVTIYDVINGQLFNGRMLGTLTMDNKQGLTLFPWSDSPESAVFLNTSLTGDFWGFNANKVGGNSITGNTLNNSPLAGDCYYGNPTFINFDKKNLAVGDYQTTVKLHGYPSITDSDSFKVYGSIYLKANENIPIDLSYVQYTGGAELGLYWIRPDGVREAVPASALVH